MNLFIPILILTIFVLLIFVSFVVFLWYHKIFEKIIVKESNFRPLNFVYQYHKGDYQKNMTVMENLFQKLKDTNVSIISAATVYYDNPRKKRKTELESDVGFLVSDSVTQKDVGALNLKIIAHKQYIYTAFPYISRFSIMLGAMRVYPAFRKKLKKLNKPEREIIEIYEMQNKAIIYLMPINS